MNSAPVNRTMRPMSLPMPGHVPTPMSAPVSSNHDLHTRQTIDRLQCIQKHLKDQGMFRRTARELLEWCSDTRAFQPQFHQCLMSCLTVINDVAGKPGFDFDLCYRLFHLCNDHRAKFQPNAAALLSVWYNNVQKLAMHQQHTRMDSMKQNNMPHQSGPSPINPNMMKMGYSQPHMGQRSHDQSSWNQPTQNVPPHPNQHPSLSVITTATVWGMSTTQTPPVPVHSQSSSTSFPQQHMRHLGSHPGSENIQSNYNNNYAGGHNKGSMGDSFQPSPIYSGSQRGIPNTRLGPQGHHMNSDQPHHPPAAAAAAAAVAAAAAAATATATATATFIKEQQDQNQMNAYDQIPPGGPMSHSMPPDTLNHRPMGQHPQHFPLVSNAHAMHPQVNRVRSQVPPQYGRASSVPSSFPVNSMTSPQPLSHNVPPMYNNGPTFKSSCRPQQSYNQVSYNGCPSASPSFNKASDGGGHVGLHRQMSGIQPTSGYSPRLPSSGPPQMHPSQNQFYPHQSQENNSDSYMSNHGQRPSIPPHYPNETRFSNSQPPIPGNPTPPLTPGSAHNVPPYPGITGMGMNDGKTGGVTGEPFFPPYAASNGAVSSPSQPSASDDLRLTFPVRDGIVLGPFRLEHNLVLSSHAFHLRQHVYKTLCERPDLDLQFKCYHHDDILKHTNWPHSVQVSVNSSPLTIPRGVDRSTHKPLYLKRVCHPGRNAIDITVSACCCSHFFVLQLVHRPSIRFVLRGLMVKRILPEINCRTKIKRNFTNGAVVPNGASGLDQNGVSIKVSLMCPITHRRIQIPARGHDCKHIQCFDLESYLQLNSDNASWRCPICHKNALLEILEVDDFMQGILKTVQDPEFEFVSIDANCNWVPISTGPMDHGGMVPNGMVKQEQFNNFPETVKQHSGSIPGNFGVKQEYISALSIKQEPHQHHHVTRPIKHDPDGPPNKRLKSVTSPGVNLNNLPAPSPGSSGACNKMENSSGFPHSYDIHQRFGSVTTSSVPMGGYFRSSSAVSMTTEMSDIAANDMVPIEKRLNPAMNRMSNGSPSRKPGCAGTPKTPQGPSTPLRPPSSNSTVLTPQSIGCTSNNCSTPSFAQNTFNVNNSVAPQAACNNNSSDQVPPSINPATPVVAMPNCPDLDAEGFGALDSLFEDSVGRVEDSAPVSLSYDPGSVMKTEGGDKDNITSFDDILPETNDLMEVLPLTDMSSTAGNTNNTEEEILSLFADP